MVMVPEGSCACTSGYGVVLPDKFLFKGKEAGSNIPRIKGAKVSKSQQFASHVSLSSGYGHLVQLPKVFNQSFSVYSVRENNGCEGV